MKTPRCKFCGCTDNKPCVIKGTYSRDWFDGYPSRKSFPCAWLAPSICTNPRCVEQAYLEARESADRIMESLARRRELLMA